MSAGILSTVPVGRQAPAACQSGCHKPYNHVPAEQPCTRWAAVSPLLAEAAAPAEFACRLWALHTQCLASPEPCQCALLEGINAVLHCMLTLACAQRCKSLLQRQVTGRALMHRLLHGAMTPLKRQDFTGQPIGHSCKLYSCSWSALITMERSHRQFKASCPALTVPLTTAHQQVVCRRGGGLYTPSIPG